MYLITTDNYQKINHGHINYQWNKDIILVHIVIVNTLLPLMGKMIRNESHVHN